MFIWQTQQLNSSAQYDELCFAKKKKILKQNGGCKNAQGLRLFLAEATWL